MQYKIISALNEKTIEEKMNELVKEGWQPINISVGTGMVTVFVVLMKKD